MFLGTLFLVIGILMILGEMGIIRGSFGDYILPVGLIALGADFMFKHFRDRR